MLHFDSDYMEGAHPSILKKLMDINFEKISGYGEDEYCESAKRKIRELCKCPEAKVHFLVGGTQTNSTVIDMLLNSYEGVISATTGHINTHESGAVEFSGHKVIELEQAEGKLDSEVLDNYLTGFFGDSGYEHMVIPGLVYISHPTEYGTLYTKKELEDISKVCAKFEIPLFLDGARMGYGIMAVGTDVKMEDIARLCDAFYIGGTKVGALFGEAVVITNHTKHKELKHLNTIIKQHGALLAKGWLLGVQFDTLFTDDLYFEIAKNANVMADKLRRGFLEKGYKLYLESVTNQQFIVLDNEKMEKLSEKVSFKVWEKVDESHTVVRFVTSWATTEEQVNELLELL